MSICRSHFAQGQSWQQKSPGGQESNSSSNITITEEEEEEREKKENQIRSVDALDGWMDGRIDGWMKRWEKEDLSARQPAHPHVNEIWVLGHKLGVLRKKKRTLTQQPLMMQKYSTSHLANLAHLGTY